MLSFESAISFVDSKQNTCGIIYLMKTTILNYRIIVEPDEQTGTGKPGYTAFCPTLGVADDGDTIEEALTRIKSLIKFHLECLAEEGKPIPAPDKDESLITMLKIEAPSTSFSLS